MNRILSTFSPRSNVQGIRSELKKNWVLRANDELNSYFRILLLHGSHVTSVKNYKIIHDLNKIFVNTRKVKISYRLRRGVADDPMYFRVTTNL